MQSGKYLLIAFWLPLGIGEGTEPASQATSDVTSEYLILHIHPAVQSYKAVARVAGVLLIPIYEFDAPRVIL